MANQTGLNPWQLQNPRSILAVLGHQEAVQVVTRRAREALHDQPTKARRVSIRYQISPV